MKRLAVTAAALVVLTPIAAVSAIVTGLAIEQWDRNRESKPPAKLVDRLLDAAARRI